MIPCGASGQVRMSVQDRAKKNDSGLEGSSPAQYERWGAITMNVNLRTIES
jgi:hypothetical protein